MTREWADYQNRAAGFFQSLGLTATTEAVVEGVRGKHELDVLVVGGLHGIGFKWAVECKAWKSNVPKEKVLALLSIVQDIGADRGFLLSEKGFQSGAVRCANGTNITLTSLEDLREIVREDLVEATLAKLSWRAEMARKKLWALHKGTDEYYSHFMKPMGDLFLLDLVLGDAKNGKYPNVYKIEEIDKKIIRHEAHSFEELVQKVGPIIADAEEYAKRFGA